MGNFFDVITFLSFLGLIYIQGYYRGQEDEKNRQVTAEKEEEIYHG